MIDEKVLIERLKEESDYEPIDYDYCDMSCSGVEHFISTHKAISIVNQLAEESKQKNANLITEFLEFVADNAFQYETDNGWALSELIDLAEKFCGVEKTANVHVVNDLAVIESLPSLYPLQSFEEEAIHRVVVSAKGTNGNEFCEKTLGSDITGCGKYFNGDSESGKCPYCGKKIKIVEPKGE